MRLEHKGTTQTLGLQSYLCFEGGTGVGPQRVQSHLLRMYDCSPRKIESKYVQIPVSLVKLFRKAVILKTNWSGTFGKHFSGSH